MRTGTGSRLIFVLILSALLSAGPRMAFAQGADDFNIPNTDTSAPAETPDTASGAETPANPEEAPGSAPADAAVGNIGAEAGGASAAAVDEPEQIEMLAANNKFSPSNKNKDPFKPLIEKKVVLPPPPPPSTTAKRD
ncbi:MAG TPA: hypothetical protein PLY73_11990, partial [Candidatus Ozemobacteraceae bacterium]|nr:hypothetical protein [Candidatus Ozemobacteraceae bacterium]